MVMVFPDQAAETPVGKLVAVPIPVAPVVAMVILGEIAAPKQTLGELDGVAEVLSGFTTTAAAFEVVVHVLELTMQ